MPTHIDRLSPLLFSGGGDLLQDLLRLGDNLLQGLLTDNAQGVLGQFAAKVAQDLDAEACAVFLVAEPDMLEFVVGSSEQVESACRGKRLSIQELQKNEWLGEAFDRKDAIRRPPEDLTSAWPASATRLRAMVGSVGAVLAVPICDVASSGPCLGVIELVNKRGDPTSGFSDEDVEQAQKQAEFVRTILYFHQVAATFRLAWPKLRNANSLDEIHEVILRMVVKVFEADRGDLVTWDHGKQGLVIRKSVGEQDVSFASFPQRSVVVGVWETGAPAFVPDTTKEANYFALNTRVKSEIAVPWELHGQRIAVLNLESFRKEYFTPLDLAVAQLLGQAAGFLYQIFGRDIQLRNAYRSLVETSSPLRNTLQAVLQGVVETHGFEFASLYLVTPDGQSMECVAHIGSQKQPPTFKKEEQALVTHVLRTGKGEHVPNPANSSIVNPNGINEFGIRGALAGVPLLVQDRVVGTLVVWNNSKPDLVQQHHIQEVQPFARVAAAAVAQAETARRREDTLRTVREIQATVLTSTDLATNLNLIVDAVHTAGFERVRIYEYRSTTDCFECRAWRGMPAEFIGYTIPRDNSRFSQEIYDVATTNPRVLLLYPTDPKYGIDPDMKPLGRTEGQPWAVRPLRFNGTVCGQIAADNAVSGRAISQESLDALELLGGLASQAFASDRLEFEAYSNHALPELFGHVAPGDPRPVVLCRLLVYATCGKALAFSRAVFLDRRDDPGRFEYAAGLGSLTKLRHDHVAVHAKQQGLASLMANAGTFDDAELNDAMKGTAVKLDEPSVQELLAVVPGVMMFPARTRDSWPDWIEDLAKRMGAEELVVAHVGDDRDSFGLLVADRRWQGRGLSPSDIRVLEAYAPRIACLILRQHSLFEQVLESRQLSAYGFLNQSLIHELRQHIGALRLDPGTLRRCIDKNRLAEARDSCQRIDDAVQKINDIVRGMELFLKPAEGFVELDVRQLLEETRNLCQKKTESLGVKVRIDVADNVGKAQLIPQLLRHALLNLLFNSLQAFERAKCTSGTVQFDARREADWVIISVIDDGPGISPADLEKVHRRGVHFSNKSDQGLGIGMEIVRRVAEAHQKGDRHGNMQIASKEGKGTTVALCLPV